MRVHLDRFFLAPVAQDPVDLLERLLVVAPVHLVGDGEVFVGMDVMEGEGARIALGGGILQAFAAEQNKERSKTAARPGSHRNFRHKNSVREIDRHVRSRVVSCDHTLPATPVSRRGA